MRLLLLLLSGLTVLVSSPVAAAAEASARRNVLFLICDDLNCDLACYGHAQVQTPHIDRLAARGVRFDRAYCQYPLCGPSRASFMTGLYPDQTLIHRNGVYLREHLPDVKTISQLFRDHGYFAVRIGKIFHYNVPAHIGTSGHDDPYSWNYTINPRGRDVEDEDQIFSLRPGSFGGTLSWLAAEGSDEQQTDGIAATEAVALLREFARSERPFYLAVGLYRPHTPYVAPRQYFDMYPLEQIRVPSVPAGYMDTLPEPARRSLTRKREQVGLEDRLAREAIQAYYASITFADAQLGRILDVLDETGLAENTVVLFTSDHGYHMGEHGYWQKTTLFESATRVPMILAGPGVAAGGTVSTPVEMVDCYPTLAELCGMTPPQFVAGVSLMPALREPQVAPREDALSQLDSGYSLRTPRYRYTEWGQDGRAGRELYDHQSDPAEMHNLAEQPEHQELVKMLAARLRVRLEQSTRKPDGVTQIHVENRRRVR